MRLGTPRPQQSGLVAGFIAVGSVIAPVLPIFGLAQTSASTASLLIALEDVATALIAWFDFHENPVSSSPRHVLPRCRCHAAVGSADTIQAPPAAIIEPVSPGKTVALAISLIPRLLSSST